MVQGGNRHPTYFMAVAVATEHLTPNPNEAIATVTHRVLHFFFVCERMHGKLKNQTTLSITGFRGRHFQKMCHHPYLLHHPLLSRCWLDRGISCTYVDVQSSLF